ncbi:MAG TPA: hypothetical protein VGF10_04305 [Gaiella sp.]
MSGDETHDRATSGSHLAVGNPSHLTPLELAVSRTLGVERRPPLQRSAPESPELSLERILEPAVAGGRCVVSFSGGRESAWLLAAATSAARRHGHPDPVPATLRRGGAASRRESEHQERIVRHLGLEDWERIDVGDDLELLGPYARRALSEAGILFPAHLYVFLPLLDLARGGALLAGGVLTDFFIYWRWARLSEVIGLRRRPRRRDLRELAVAALPRRARRAILRPERGLEPPAWLRPDAAREAQRLLLSQFGDIPVSFAAAMSSQRTHRCHTATRESLDALGAAAGARFLMPLRDDRYVAAVAAAGGRRGFGDRSTTAERLAGSVLPVELLQRSDGAGDRYATVGDATRAFLDTWSGAGLDSEVVDVAVLRDTWSSGDVPYASTMLLQAAFATERASMKKVGQA